MTNPEIPYFQPAPAHTPGPWKAHFEEAYYVTGPDLGRVAMMMNLKGRHGLGGRRSGAESAANARLIAAAPELLEAAQRMIEAWVKALPENAAWKAGRADELENLEFREMNALRAAIYKATGAQA